jgi:GDPmannose 4,6-dehydratase
LIGDAGKAKKVLGWEPKVSFEDLVVMMVEADLRAEQCVLEGTRAPG